MAIIFVRKMKMSKIKFIILVIFCANLAYAGNHEDGEAAYKAKNYALAIKKFTLGAISGNFISLQKLAAMKKRGEGNINDINKSIEQLKTSAESGNVEAQLITGIAYIFGDVVEKNCKEGVRWYRLAASNGNEVAQHNLGGLYFDGQCVPMNYVYGYMWWSLAVAQNDTEFDRRSLNGYATNKMTKEQVSEAQRLASVCYKNNYKNCD